jgi:hypothetical protein
VPLSSTCEPGNSAAGTPFGHPPQTTLPVPRHGAWLGLSGLGHNSLPPIHVSSPPVAIQDIGINVDQRSCARLQDFSGNDDAGFPSLGYMTSSRDHSQGLARPNSSAQPQDAVFRPATHSSSEQRSYRPHHSTTCTPYSDGAAYSLLHSDGHPQLQLGNYHQIIHTSPAPLLVSVQDSMPQGSIGNIASPSCRETTRTNDDDSYESQRLAMPSPMLPYGYRSNALALSAGHIPQLRSTCDAINSQPQPLVGMMLPIRQYQSTHDDGLGATTYAGSWMDQTTQDSTVVASGHRPRARIDGTPQITRNSLLHPGSHEPLRAFPVGTGSGDANVVSQTSGQAQPWGTNCERQFTHNLISSDYNSTALPMYRAMIVPIIVAFGFAPIS